MNLSEVASLTEDQAREYLESLRWPNGPVCPHCTMSNCTRMKGKAHRKGCIQCNDPACREQFTVRTGSVLESSKVPLAKWVLAFHLLCSSKKGFSAKQLQRELSLGSYKTAWFMMHRIRHAMETRSWDKPMEGVIEADETYVGGKPRYRGTNQRGRGTLKQPVMALVERDGSVRTAPIPQVSGPVLKRAIRENVGPTAIIVTDDNKSYYGIGKEFGGHEIINHSTKTYARYREDGFVVTTNSVESFFGLVKRGHYGVYHLWGKQHLHRYCAEFGFRWNHRKVTDAQRREAAIKAAEGKRLRYETPKIQA